MKYPVSNESDFRNVPKEASEIHLVRPIGFKKLSKFLETKGIQKVFLSKSTKKRLGKKTVSHLARQGIDVTVESKAGRPISVQLEKIQELVELHKDYQSFRKIEELTGIPKSTSHYLIKYAQRSKVKNKDKIVYL
jgi:hypothetical protein